MREKMLKIAERLHERASKESDPVVDRALSIVAAVIEDELNADNDPRYHCHHCDEWFPSVTQKLNHMAQIHGKPAVGLNL